MEGEMETLLQKHLRKRQTVELGPPKMATTFLN
jgi:hypothetical protein